LVRRGRAELVAAGGGRGAAGSGSEVAVRSSSDPAWGVVGKRGQRRQLCSPCLSPTRNFFGRSVCDPTLFLVEF